MKDLQTILAEVAAKHGLSLRCMTDPGRFKHLVEARQEYYYRALTETWASAVEVGRMANRHHTSVLHGVVSYALSNSLPIPRGYTYNPKLSYLRVLKFRAKQSAENLSA